MPKITARATVVTAVLLLALAGCAGTPESTPSEPEQATTAEQTPEATSSETESSPAPATVAPIETAAATGDAAFVARAADLVRGFGYDVTNEQLLTAGEYACQQIQAGASPESITALEGVTAAINERFVLDAQELLCP